MNNDRGARSHLSSLWSFEQRTRRKAYYPLIIAILFLAVLFIVLFFVTLPLGFASVLMRVVVPAVSILILTILFAGSLSLIWFPWRLSVLRLRTKGEIGIAFVAAMGATERVLLLNYFNGNTRAESVGRAMVVIGDSRGLRFWRTSKEDPIGSISWADIHSIGVGQSSDYKIPTAVLQINDDQGAPKLLFPVVRQRPFSTVVMTPSELEALVDQLRQLRHN